MKFLKIITHPILLVTSFSFVVISGDKFSWFYIIIVLLSLIQLKIHAIAAIFGLILLFAGLGARLSNRVKNIFFISGATLLMLSLLIFFESGKSYNEWNTFSDRTSQISMGVFIIFWIIFFIKHLVGLAKDLNKKKNNSMGLQRI